MVNKINLNNDFKLTTDFQYAPHALDDLSQIKFYENAYDTPEKKSGFFCDVVDAFHAAEHSICIAAWGLENITCGVHQEQLTDVMVEFIAKPSCPTLALHVWSHLVASESDNFDQLLLSAIKRYALRYKRRLSERLSELKIRIGLLLLNKNMPGFSDDLAFLEQCVKQVEALKKGKFPPNLLWRTSRGQNGKLLCTLHQKLIVVDDKIAFIGGIDLVHGRDVSYAYKLKPSDEDDYRDAPYRDVHYRISIPAFVHDVQDEFTAGFLYKCRPAKWDYGISHFFSSALKTRFGTKSIRMSLAFWLHEAWRKGSRSIFNDMYNFHMWGAQYSALVMDRVPEKIIPLQEMAALPQIQFLRTRPDVMVRSDYLQSVDEHILHADAKAALHVKSPNISDTSILQTYIHAIKSAERFIYIENQYFSTRELEKGEDNPIPKLLIDKVVEKQQAGEPFHVYIVLPMFAMTNVNDPDAFSTTLVSAYQADTIKGFWRELDKQLGPITPDSYVTIATLRKCEPDAQSQIYIHAKYLNVDDNILVSGSANINERSMSGELDVESGFVIYANGCPRVQKEICEQRIRMMRAVMGEAFIQTYHQYVEQHIHQSTFVDAVHHLQNVSREYLHDLQTAEAPIKLPTEDPVVKAMGQHGQTLFLHSHFLLQDVKGAAHSDKKLVPLPRDNRFKRRLKKMIGGKFGA